MLKNSKRMLSVSKICEEDRNKNKIISPERTLMNTKEYSQKEYQKEWMMDICL